MSLYIPTVATYNAGGGEDPGPSDAQIVKLLTEVFQPDKFGAKWKTTIFMGQEFQEKHDRLFLQELGLCLHRFGPECVVAWDPDHWTDIAYSDVRLNPKTPFYRPDGDKPIYCDAPGVLLANRVGLVFDALSLHLPSSVQQANAPKNRLKAAAEAAEILRDRHESNFAHGHDYAGDFNIDPDGGFGPWPIMQKQVTGLNVLTAPKNTLGRRKVDHHAVLGFEDDGGKVLRGPTDHNAHLRRLKFEAYKPA